MFPNCEKLRKYYLENCMGYYSFSYTEKPSCEFTRLFLKRCANLNLK